jgi:outer membrane protein OmpA-like peptidoglycan-associated protein
MRLVILSMLALAGCEVHATGKVSSSGNLDVHVTDYESKPLPSPSATPRKPVLELDVEFNFDKASLTDADKQELSRAETLDALCKALAAHKQLVVEGHADSRGSAGHNLKLTAARAERVRQAFLGNKVCHIDPAALVAVGRGAQEPRRCQEKPECDGKDHGPRSCEDCWKQNRKTIVAIAEETEPVPATLAQAPGCSRVLVLGEERGSRMCE